MKSKLKPKMQNDTITKNTVPSRGDEEWELVAPLILLMELQRSFLE